MPPYSLSRELLLNWAHLGQRQMVPLICPEASHNAPPANNACNNYRLAARAKASLQAKLKMKPPISRFTIVSTSVHVV